MVAFRDLLHCEKGIRGDTVALVGENEPQLFWSEYAAQAIGADLAYIGTRFIATKEANAPAEYLRAS